MKIEKEMKIEKIVVVGAGLMGHGIAQIFALADLSVYLCDVSEEKLSEALDSVKGNLQMLASLGVIKSEHIDAVLDRIQTNTDLGSIVSEADLVVECVFEDLALKQEIFKKLDSLCPDRTILASNSSSFTASALASVTKRPEKVVVAHFFNPPYLIPLVEIVGSSSTSEETVKAVYDLMCRAKKRPVILKKEVPGFLANRLQAALMREAMSLVEKGVASAQEIDIAVKESIGLRWSVMGPFQIFELAGLDMASAAASVLMPDLESSGELPDVLKEKIAKGELGVKTGKGFYTWTPESALALKQTFVQALVKNQLER